MWILAKFVVWVILQNNEGWDHFKTPILREILRIQNPLLEELCVFGSHTFVPRSWMCKKQTSASHSSTEAEVISLDAGFRTDGSPALDLWSLVIEACHSSPNQTNKTKNCKRATEKLVGNSSITLAINKFQPRTPISIWPILITFHQAEHILVPMLCCISLRIMKPWLRMIIKGRSTTMRHVSRTHRVAIDSVFDRINLDPKIQTGYIDTKHQLADIWPNVISHMTNGLQLFNISHFRLRWEFQLDNCTKTMGKRMQEQKGEEISLAKIDICSDEPVFSCSDQFLMREKSDCIQKSWYTHGSRETWEEHEKKFKIRRSVLKRDCKMHTLAGGWTQ